jgi:hypothetical protein
MEFAGDVLIQYDGDGDDLFALGDIEGSDVEFAHVSGDFCRVDFGDIFVLAAADRYLTRSL